MGLKFLKFKGKLNKKTKETVPDIVCLRYQVHSEFDAPLRLLVSVPTTSSTQLGTNNVIKEKKAVLKPQIQNVFETNTSIPKTSTTNTPTSISNTSTSSHTNVNNNNNDKSKTNGILTTNQNNASVIIEPVPTKGILKKSTPDESIVSETKLNQNDAIETDDHKKSALIFMTENHDAGEELSQEKHTKKEKTIELTKNSVLEITEPNTKTTLMSNQEVEAVELRLKDSKNTEPKFHRENEDKKETSYRSDSESEQGDAKTVRWRETVMEINPPNLEIDTQKSEESADDFKVHFVKHQNFSTGLQSEVVETEDSEPEENDQPPMNSYGNRISYSSQAASIFFAGEEPEPTPRVRNVAQEEDGDIPSNVHSSV